MNQYPAVSHTFIRREILALEKLGVNVTRYALKPKADGLVDAADTRELQLTGFIQHTGIGRILACVFKTVLSDPAALWRGLALIFKIGRKSERGLLKHLVYLVEAMVLASWCRRDQIDHLHVHFGTNSAAIAMLAKQFSGTPYSMTVHGIEEFEKAVLLSLDEKLRHAEFAVCVSSYGRAQLMRWVPADLWYRIKLVRCGVDQSFLESKISPIKDVPRLVCVGRLCVHKAQTLLVAAAEQLTKQGIDFELILVGDGELREQVETSIAKAGLGGNIKITGWASGQEVRGQIEDARALVLPSISENLPVVIMEAMSLGRPVLSTYIAGIPELVRPGETGWLVPASDVHALADAMKELLGTSVEQLEKMGQKGRTRVVLNHDAIVEASKLKMLFEELG